MWHFCYRTSHFQFFFLQNMTLYHIIKILLNIIFTYHKDPKYLFFSHVGLIKDFLGSMFQNVDIKFLSLFSQWHILFFVNLMYPEDYHFYMKAMSQELRHLCTAEIGPIRDSLGPLFLTAASIETELCIRIFTTLTHWASLW